MAFRVPVADVSCVDLTIRLSKSTSYKDICAVMKEASENSMEGFLEYTDEEVVSSDFIGSTASAIFDAGAGMGLSDRFFKMFLGMIMKWATLQELLIYCIIWGKKRLN